VKIFPTLAIVASLGAVPSAVLAATLHPGDKISVTVYNHPELSEATVTLDALGQASLPVAGLVGGSGETPATLSGLIRARLARYVRRPAVDVQLLSQGTNIFVSGGPGGVLAYTPGETLSGALTQLHSNVAAADAGAAPPQSDTNLFSASLASSGIDLHHVVIERDGVDLPPVDARQLAIAGSPGPLLQPDDTIKLQYKPIAVTVQGEVKRPGIVYLDSDEPLSDALLQAGGTNDTGSAIAFTLTRDSAEKSLSTSSAEYREPARAGDIIYVPHDLRVGVVGQVNKPGDVELRGDGSLLSALYYAGGPTKYGDIRDVGVIHQGVQKNYDVSKLTHGAPADNPVLADGDTVFVPEGHKVDFSLLFQAIISASYLRFL
jgi:polysaccharide export outer membrane protein